MIASTMLINRWFRSNVATVAGIAAVGSGVAAVILPNVTVALISTYSLSAAFLFESVLALVLGVLVFLLLRNYPRGLAGGGAFQFASIGVSVLAVAPAPLVATATFPKSLRRSCWSR